VQINQEMVKVMPNKVGVENFAQPLTRYNNRATADLRNQVRAIDRDLICLPQFARITRDLHNVIEIFVHRCEADAKSEYAVYQGREQERFRKQMFDEVARVRQEGKTQIMMEQRAKNRQLEALSAQA
jgi:hypothetical protein